MSTIDEDEAKRSKKALTRKQYEYLKYREKVEAENRGKVSSDVMETMSNYLLIVFAIIILLFVVGC